MELYFTATDTDVSGVGLLAGLAAAARVVGSIQDPEEAVETAVRAPAAAGVACLFFRLDPAGTGFGVAAHSLPGPFVRARPAFTGVSRDGTVLAGRRLLLRALGSPEPVFGDEPADLFAEILTPSGRSGLGGLRVACVRVDLDAVLATLGRLASESDAPAFVLYAGCVTAVLAAARLSAAARQERALLEGDLERRRQTELELAVSRQELEQRVAARTAELATEVDERRRSEQALQRERNLLRTLMDSIPDAIYFKDNALRFVACNAALVRLLGAGDQAAVAGRTDRDFFSVVSAGTFAHDDRRVLAGETIVGRIEDVPLPGGGRLRCSTTKVPVRDGSGRIVGLAGITRDITKDVEAEAQIRSLARFPKDNPTPVLRADAEGRILYANPASGALLDCWGVTVGGPLPPQVVALTVRARAARRAYDGEVTCCNRIHHFSVVWVEEEAHASLYGRDITDHRAAEAQLAHAQRMDSIGLLAGGIAHDFNNLMGVVSGYAGMLASRPDLDQGARDAVESIVAAGARAAGLTRQLLAFSRRQQLQERELSLNDVVTETASMLRPLVGKNIHVDLQLAADLGPVLADRGQVGQVLVNLVVNARDAMPGGGVITVTTANAGLAGDATRSAGDAPPGEHVLLSVSDTGHGMDERTRLRIFEPFFTTKAEGKGTGLGLSTVYGIVRQSRGQIAVESDVGRGTTFRIWLPRIDGEIQQPAPGGTEAAGRPRGGSESVLVVDDEEMLRSMFQIFLQDLGYTVLLAADAAGAELVAAHSRIDVLVADVVMPGMRGPELYARLRAAAPGLRCVYVSGYAGDALQDNATQGPGCRFLHKPFSPGDLGRAVREVLDDR
jgi:two-component system, cell cycle sensor histidine kinase and response regulator CckA